MPLNEYIECHRNLHVRRFEHDERLRKKPNTKDYKQHKVYVALKLRSFTKNV